MKLATVRNCFGAKRLAVVSNDNRNFVFIPHLASTLLGALESWEHLEPAMQRFSECLNAGSELTGNLSSERVCAPIPRSYQFLDGSAYLSHVERVRKARGAEIPSELYADPLMYQGLSDCFLGPFDDIEVPDENMGIDVEGEVAIATDFVPMGTPATEAGKHIKLIFLLNDISLRNVIASEIKKGFGFVQGKPASACGPIAITPDELGDAWDGERPHFSFVTYVNDTRLGSPDTSEMHFSFPELIAHAAKTRHLSAGTIIGSGTVSNKDPERGFSCIVEKRMEETIRDGKPTTPFLRFGDLVYMYAEGKKGKPLGLGSICQKVKKYDKTS